MIIVSCDGCEKWQEEAKGAKSAKLEVQRERKARG
jgi:hypothetical protein